MKSLRMEMMEESKYLLLLFAETAGVLEEWMAEVGGLLLKADADAVVAVSGVHGDFGEAGAAYLEASAAYDNRFVMGTDSLLRFTDVNMTTASLDEYTGGFIDSFHSSLLTGDVGTVRAKIDELIQALGKRQFSLFTFRVIYNYIINALLNRYLDGEDVKECLHVYDVFHLSGCRKASDLAVILQDMCERIIKKGSLAVKEEPGVILRISEYLRQHYDDTSLSIGAVAERFGITAAAVSQEYKKVTGLHPSDHLSLLRMERARELLLQSDKPIREVGLAVGYCDVTSFIRRFKREMSVTPAEYRKAHRKRKEEAVALLEGRG